MSKHNCRTCGTTGEGNFYKNSLYYCKSCWNKRTYQAGIDKQNKLKEDRGGCCEKCGYDRYLGALDWHHLDPTVKEFSIGKRRGLSEAALKEEIDKCQLLCANCHREVHAELQDYGSNPIGTANTIRLKQLNKVRTENGN